MRSAASSSAARSSGSSASKAARQSVGANAPVVVAGERVVVEALRCSSASASSPRLRTSARIVATSRGDVVVALAPVVDQARELPARSPASLVSSRSIRRPPLATSARNRSTSAATRGSVLSAARLTISRAETCMITSVSTRPLSFSVRPVETRSTIRLARPSAGRQLHRAVELDAFGLDALPLELAAGEVRVLGGDAQVARVPPLDVGARRARPPTAGNGRWRGRPARRARNSRTPRSRRSRRSRPAPRRSATKVATSNARTRISRMSPPSQAKRERAVALVVERRFGHHAGARHQRQRLVEDAALGHGEGQRLGLGGHGGDLGRAGRKGNMAPDEQDDSPRRGCMPMEGERGERAPLSPRPPDRRRHAIRRRRDHRLDPLRPSGGCGRAGSARACPITACRKNGTSAASCLPRQRRIDRVELAPRSRRRGWAARACPSAPPGCRARSSSVRIASRLARVCAGGRPRSMSLPPSSISARSGAARLAVEREGEPLQPAGGGVARNAGVGDRAR